MADILKRGLQNRKKALSIPEQAGKKND